tara:strand:+ start:1087 stop:3186 length:2100 start_codon:yes stop_codon:yes gene_type:complete
MGILTYDIQQRGLLTESSQKNNNVIKKTLLDIGDIIDGTFSFGTGIGAFLTPVTDILNSEYPHMTEENMIMLYITAIWIITNRHRDKVKVLLEKIKERNLSFALPKVVDFLRSTEEIALKIADEVGYTVSSIIDIGAFTFFAFPILDALRQLISSGEITLDNGAIYLKSMVGAIGVLTVKNIFNSIIKRLRFRKKQFGGHDELINEQAEKSKIRKVFENDDIVVEVPLNPQTLCDMSSGWCKDWFLKSLTKGTPYVVKSKHSSDKFLVHHKGSVFLYREPNPSEKILNLTAYDSDGDWAVVKKLLADKPDLQEFFKVEYTNEDRLRYGMGIKEDLITDWSKTNDFSKAVWEVYKGNESPDSLESYFGDDIDYTGPGRYSKREDNILMLDDKYVWLDVDYDGYKENIALLGDNDWYFDMALEYYHDSPYEEIDSEELHYLACTLDEENFLKTNELLELMGEEPKRDCHEWDDGEWDEFLDTHFRKEWEDASNSMLYELGYGLGIMRSNNMKEVVRDESLFPFQYKNGYIEIKLSYPQLLWAIHSTGARDFSQLIKEPFNEIGVELGDSWYDVHDYTEESLNEFNDDYKRFIDKLLERDDLGGLVKQRQNLIDLLNELGFKRYNYQGSNPENLNINSPLTANVKFIDKENEKEIRIHHYDAETDYIEIVVEKIGEDRTTQRKSYRIPISKLSDYVYSDQLF